MLGSKPNQLDRLRDEVSVSAADLLSVSKTPGTITEAGLRNDISVGIQYLASWLGGNGAVGIYNLMEDAATAEIARSQVWQWLHNDILLEDGPKVTRERVEVLIDEELTNIREQYGEEFNAERFGQATALFTEVALADNYVDFLTIPAYERMPDGRACSGGGGHAGPGPGAGGPGRGRPGSGSRGRQGRWPALDEDGLPVAGTATAALIPVMTRICGAAGVVSDPRDLRTYERDGRTSHRTAPGLVVLPETADRSPRWSGPAPGPRFCRGPRLR